MRRLIWRLRSLVWTSVSAVGIGIIAVLSALAGGETSVSTSLGMLAIALAVLSTRE